ncbi:hypothetical protein ACFYXM_28935 [Streptomyces sp. NPDC002476]|uniref:hypothetical protein n=1 Tax=Streptomyces sp. NPDC002476 TaxID=3364648 RepID=UPI003682B2ED
MTGKVHRLATPGTTPRGVVASPAYVQYADDAPLRPACSPYGADAVRTDGTAVRAR